MSTIIKMLMEFNVVSYIMMAGFLILIGVIVLLILFFIKQNRFIKTLKTAISDNYEILTDRYPEEYIVKKSKLIVKMLRDTELEKAKDFLYKTNLAGSWVQALKQYADKQYFKGVLSFEIEDGYFLCFKHALISEKLKKLFLEWLKKDESYLKKIAYMSNGSKFNGAKALKILNDYFSLIKEMIIYNDWRYRFFSLIILMNHRDTSTERMLFELFKDPEYRIRKTLIDEFNPDNQELFQKSLFNTIINDPHPEVRKHAIKRYHSTYEDFPEIEIENLKNEEILHLIEAFRKGNRSDEAMATDLVLHENHEIRFASSHFLDRAGVLSRYSRELDLSDSRGWERKLNIFTNAAECGATDFITTLLDKNTTETLLMAGKIFEKVTIPDSIQTFLKKAVNNSNIQVYEQAVKAATRVNSNETKSLLIKELRSKIDEKNKLTILVDSVTNLADRDFIDPLIEIMDTHPDMSEQVKDALTTKEESSLAYKIIEILKDENRDIRLKINLYFVLAKLGKDYCLSFLIEQLPIIPVKWMGELGKILKSYPPDILKEKMEYYLNKNDGHIKSNLIALIPNTGLETFIDKIREGLYDIDPLVRIASSYALIDMGDKKSIKKAIDLLRDPVEDVRTEVAYALGRTGNDEILNALRSYLFDDNEVLTVKKSILKGLSESLDTKTTDLLLDVLENSEELLDYAIDALKNHRYYRGIVRLIERLKDSGEEIRNRIIKVIERMGIEAKPFLMEILKSDLARLKDSVSEVLDKIGGTDEEIVKLSHKNPEIRREAAANLSLIQTPKAFRGLILASRDPDREVRVNVVKALEKLETDEGKDILNLLENDPDPKIRKYTHWALERLKAKELV